MGRTIATTTSVFGLWVCVGEDFLALCSLTLLPFTLFSL
jgi:hypothetical protein